MDTKLYLYDTKHSPKHLESMNIIISFSFMKALSTNKWTDQWKEGQSQTYRCRDSLNEYFFNPAM